MMNVNTLFCGAFYSKYCGNMVMGELQLYSEGCYSPERDQVKWGLHYRGCCAYTLLSWKNVQSTYLIRNKAWERKQQVQGNEGTFQSNSRTATELRVLGSQPTVLSCRQSFPMTFQFQHFGNNSRGIRVYLGLDRRIEVKCQPVAYWGNKNSPFLRCYSNPQ